MLAVKSMDVRDHFKDWCNQVINGETLIVSRPKNENVVIVSEKEYNELQKAKKNADYLAMLDRSRNQLEQGKTIFQNKIRSKACFGSLPVPFIVITCIFLLAKFYSQTGTLTYSLYLSCRRSLLSFLSKVLIS